MTNLDAAATTSDVEDLINVMKSRRNGYGFLSRLYRKEVDEGLLDELFDSTYPVSTGSDDADEGYRLIATFLCGIWENTVTELAADYMRTFFGHGIDGHAAAYPFESVHTSEKRLLMQSARDEVLAIYRSAGLDKQDSWKEGEDHIAVELEFMQVLIDREMHALERGDEDEVYAQVVSQKNFLEDHIVSWSPLLTAEVRQYAKTDFYKGLAFLTDGFLENDREVLNDLTSTETYADR